MNIFLEDDYTPQAEIVWKWKESTGMAEIGIDEDGWWYICMGKRKIVLTEEEVGKLHEVLGKVLYAV